MSEAVINLPQTMIPVATVSDESDEALVRRVLAGETALFEIIMRRYNQRLYRAARAITRDDSLAEDIMQDAYVRAYEHLSQFAGRAPFGAWLTRIAVNESLARLRDAKHYSAPAESREFEDAGDRMDRFASQAASPEEAAASHELSRILESLIEALPDKNRSVFVLRDVEEMSTAEVSAALSISEVSVKVRLHRARAALRQALKTHITRGASQVYTFHAVRCDRIVSNVFQRIQKVPASAEN